MCESESESEGGSGGARREHLSPLGAEHYRIGCPALGTGWLAPEGAAGSAQAEGGEEEHTGAGCDDHGEGVEAGSGGRRGRRR